MAQQTRILVGLAQAVRKPMLRLPRNVNQRCFGGMIRELLRLANVHRAPGSAQTVQEERFHLHIADQVQDGSDLRFAIQRIGDSPILLRRFGKPLVL